SAPGGAAAGCASAGAGCTVASGRTGAVESGRGRGMGRPSTGAADATRTGGAFLPAAFLAAALCLAAAATGFFAACFFAASCLAGAAACFFAWVSVAAARCSLSAINDTIVMARDSLIRGIVALFSCGAKSRAQVSAPRGCRDPEDGREFALVPVCATLTQRAMFATIRCDRGKNLANGPRVFT